MKLLVLFLIVTSQSLVADIQFFHEEYDNKTNSVVVKDIANTMHKFLIKNQGVIEESPYEELVGVSSISYPSTLRYLVRIDIDKYRTDILKASKVSESKKYDDKKMHKKIYSEKFKLWIKNKTRENNILRNCTKEEQRYLLNRGISIDTEYRIKGEGVFLSVEVTLDDCNDSKGKQTVSMKQFVRDNSQNIYTCLVESLGEEVTIIYSKDTLFMSNGTENWKYKGTKNRNEYENIKNSNFKVKVNGSYMNMFVNNVLKEKVSCSKKTSDTKMKQIPKTTKNSIDKDTMSLW